MKVFHYSKTLVVIGLLLFGVGASAEVAGPHPPGRPAKVVNRYVLTSTSQGDEHDPTAWRLLGSNDDGASWTLLDTQTNQSFSERSQRHIYRIDNRQAFSTYRLQIDAVKLAAVTLDMSVQLSGVNLLGPLANAPDESRVKLVVSSSCSDPLRGPPEFALDDDPHTDWCDYGLNAAGGCWLQIGYVTEARTAVTNLSQVELLTHLPPSRIQMADAGLRVLSNLVAKAAPPRRLTGYALTSANDAPQRDPRTWVLLGSDDNAATWTTVDQRVNEVFTGRLERRVFNLTNAAAFRIFRLRIDSSPGTSGGCQLADLEPLYVDSQNDAKYSLVVAASSDNPPMESVEAAFDHKFRAKWFTFNDATPENPCWLQWQCTPREDEWPVIGQREVDLLARRHRVNPLLAETNFPTVPITGYALTSANDAPGRDPSDWKLLGSHDRGNTWDELDRRRQEQFSGRLLRRVFRLAKPAAYETYRLQIDSVRSPATDTAAQLAKLEPLIADRKIASSLVPMVSSRNENFPLETVDNLFDGDPQTKWLDTVLDNSNRASWIEWHYAKGTWPGAIDLDRENITQSLSQQLEMELSAAVLFADPARGLAGLGDATGFQWIHLDPWPAQLAPGTQVKLRGTAEVKRGSLFVSGARVEAPRPLPAGGEEDYFCGSVTGRVASVYSGPLYCGATLNLADGTTIVARLPGSRFPAAPDLGCPVKMDGVIERQQLPNGGRVPGAIWLANSEAIALAPQDEYDWNRLPGYAPSLPLPAAVCVRGTLRREAASGSVFLLAGTNQFRTDLSFLATANGARMKVAGWLANEGGQLALRHVCAATEPPSPAAPPLLTRIADVRHFIERYEGGHATARLRGVVTYIDLDLGEFYLQDGADAIVVRGQMNAGLHPRLSEEGQLVELAGVVQDDDLDVTGFVRMLGKGKLPEPVRPSWENLLSGENDARWVEVEGVITEAENGRITLSIAGGQLVAWINELSSQAARSLLGSVVRVRGVCAPVVNARSQELGVRLLVPSLEFVHLLSLAPEDPFALPLLPMEAIMNADATNAVARQRYVRTRGVLTCKQGRLLFLQDKMNGVRVVLRDDFEAAPGDQVETVGVPQPDGYSAKLIQAVARKTSRGRIPAALPLDLAKVTMGDLAEEQDATRVSLEAVLVNESTDASRRTLNLRNEQAQQVFRAYLPATGSLGAVPVGSRLRVDGVFKAIQDRAPDIGQAVTSFELYLNSPADIVVLERPTWWTARHALQLSAVFCGVGALGLGWIWLLRARVRQRTRDLAAKIEELKRSELSLATEVAERKRVQADADKAHKQLLAVARQAGMAEVATGILHNVGNVLNSVNVSSTMISQHLHQCRPDGLEKALALMRRHEALLGAFFREHDKGRQLLPYLTQWAGRLASHQAGALNELGDLVKNIQHIKDIVAVQQDCAKFAGLTEKLPAAELVDDALLMNASSLERHQIQVRRQFDPGVPPVEVDRHKVLQILVNLIRNAAQACDESAKNEKHIDLGIHLAGKTVRVTVTDNGVGIAPENLSRIFNHGFTTRKNGHGFGLHNSALTAREIGGSLQAASAGAGHGATFTLELPAAGK